MRHLTREMYFDSTDFPVTITKKNGKFYLLCNKLHIIEMDQSLDNAYEKLNLKREELFQALNIFKFDDFNAVLDLKRQEKKSQKLIVWIVAIIFCLSPCLFLGLLYNKITNFATNLEHKIEYKIKTKLSDYKQLGMSLNAIATTLETVTPERKEELQQNLRRIVKVIEPLTSELQPLFNKEK